MKVISGIDMEEKDAVMQTEAERKAKEKANLEFCFKLAEKTIAFNHHHKLAAEHWPQEVHDTIDAYLQQVSPVDLSPEETNGHLKVLADSKIEVMALMLLHHPEEVQAYNLASESDRLDLSFLVESMKPKLGIKKKLSMYMYELSSQQLRTYYVYGAIDKCISQQCSEISKSDKVSSRLLGLRKIIDEESELLFRSLIGCAVDHLKAYDISDADKALDILQSISQDMLDYIAKYNLNDHKSSLSYNYAVKLPRTLLPIVTNEDKFAISGMSADFFISDESLKVMEQEAEVRGMSVPLKYPLLAEVIGMSDVTVNCLFNHDLTKCSLHEIFKEGKWYEDDGLNMEDRFVWIGDDDEEGGRQFTEEQCPIIETGLLRADYLVEYELLQGAIANILSSLKENESEVLMLHVGLKDGIERDFEDIRSMFNNQITRSDLYNMYHKSMQRLKHTSMAKQLEPYRNNACLSDHYYHPNGL